MNKKGKTMIGGALIAGMLAGATFGIFNREQKPAADFYHDYNGADNTDALHQRVAQLSGDKTLFVMYHLDTCPHCQRMSSYLRDAHDETDLDYNVLRVEVKRYPKIGDTMMRGQYVPENHVHFGGVQPHVFTGATESKDALLEYMAAVHQWRTEQQKPVAGSRRPQVVQPVF